MSRRTAWTARQLVRPLDRHPGRPSARHLNRQLARWLGWPLTEQLVRHPFHPPRSRATAATRNPASRSRPDAFMPLEKRSLTLEGHRTSLALEPEFWDGLAELAAIRGMSLPRLVAEIDRGRRERGLASAVRVAVLSARPQGVPAG